MPTPTLSRVKDSIFRRNRRGCPPRDLQMSTGSMTESTCSSRVPDRSGGGWTWEENKLFELALIDFEEDTPDRWEKVAACVPGKTVEEVNIHYQRLIDDLNAIEAGRSSYYPSFASNSEDCYAPKQPSCARGKRSAPRAPSEHERKKGVPWSEEEHKLFLMGLSTHGKGDWRNISRNFVTTRTPTQVASHAQKYFNRQNSGGKDKRRSSIHDITIASLSHDELLAAARLRAPTPQAQATSTTLPRTFSLQRNDAAGVSNAPVRANQFMQHQFGAAPYGMTMQVQNPQDAGLHGNVVCDDSSLFQMQSDQQFHGPDFGQY
ncbi:transcription factor DIVARICATA-like isoform X1 [Musa acuminata AAA Group]|uniref:transcription factor DIVARICATA-like isoform X1 n=2 Tax=Musa acuminata AAA Group TaxID=214697 RepID=UPI0031D0E9E6